MGKGRRKGVPNKIGKEEKALAKLIVKDAIMEKAELLARLSRQGRSDIGKHLKVENGQAQVHVDPEHTDTIREITVKAGPKDDQGNVMWNETKIKVADPVVPLQGLARIYGLEKAQQPTLSAKLLVGVLAKAGIDPEKLLLAAVGTLELEA